MSNLSDDFFLNLKAISEASFPKHCGTCGMNYISSEDFVAKTKSLSGKSGLKSSYDDSDVPIVELYRNCVCGSTLMSFFSDRRDNSEKGQNQRAIFEKLLINLDAHNVPRLVARVELLKVLRGEKSTLIDDLRPFLGDKKDLNI